jgi:tetraacyldisaccharide 4'-kinase
VTAAGIVARVRLSYPDHYRYRRSDASKILAHTSHGDLQLLTTEKDLARMKNDPEVSELAGRSKTLPVALALDDEDAFKQWLFSVLPTARAAAAPAPT